MWFLLFPGSVSGTCVACDGETGWGSEMGGISLLLPVNLTPYQRYVEKNGGFSDNMAVGRLLKVPLFKNPCLQSPISSGLCSLWSLYFTKAPPPSCSTVTGSCSLYPTLFPAPLSMHQLWGTWLSEIFLGFYKFCSGISVDLLFISILTGFPQE